MSILAAVILPLILQAWIFAAAVQAERAWAPALFGLYPLAVVAALSAGLDTDPTWPAIPVMVIAIAHTIWLRGGRWLHERKDGGPDRRFRSNQYILNSPEPARRAALVAALAGAAGAGLAWLVMTEVRAVRHKTAPVETASSVAPPAAAPDMAQALPDLARPVRRKRSRAARSGTAQDDQ